MLKFNENFFKVKFVYNPKVVNKIITIIKFSKNEQRVEHLSLLLFKMMWNVVKKNIGNYQNLFYNSPIDYVSEFNELISDCYIVMINCVNNFKIAKNNNFYFYYNKSLSRRFFRDFKKELKHNDSNVMTNDDSIKNNINYSEFNEIDTMDIMLKNYGLTELEIELCHHRIEGKSVNEFVDKNGINITHYNKILRSIKQKIKDIKIE